jgi:hypothetical protein
VTGTAAGANLAAMLAILQAVIGTLRSALRPRASLVAENLVLRQQLAILRRATPRPRLRPIDRAFWVMVARVWSRWAECLAIVQPATVIHGIGGASLGGGRGGLAPWVGRPSRRSW